MRPRRSPMSLPVRTSASTMDDGLHSHPSRAPADRRKPRSPRRPPLPDSPVGLHRIRRARTPRCSAPPVVGHRAPRSARLRGALHVCRIESLRHRVPRTPRSDGTPRLRLRRRTPTSEPATERNRGRRPSAKPNPVASFSLALQETSSASTVSWYRCRLRDEGEAATECAHCSRALKKTCRGPEARRQSTKKFAIASAGSGWRTTSTMLIPQWMVS